MSVKTIILDLLAKDGLVFSKLDNLFSFISKTYNVDASEVERIFKRLVNDGYIYEVRKGVFISIPSHGYVKGTFIGNVRGYGFCQIDNSDKDDIFIPANMCEGVIDGDRVIIKVLTESEEGSDGKVVSIFKPVSKITGVVQKVGDNYFIDPDNNHIAFKIKLKRGKGQYQENDKVVVSITRNKTSLLAEICEVLGKSDDVKACELAIIRDHQLYETFSSEVLDAVKELPTKILPNQRKGRLDLTDKVIFTIDGKDAKDLDDAVSIEKTEKGYVLGVHIADVGEYVKCESVIDEEAYNRGTSVYFPCSVLPMLPKEISNGICSLNENEERLALSCMITLDDEGNVKSHEIRETIIKSCARLNYTDVYKVLCDEQADEKTEKLKNELQMMHMLSLKLQEKSKKEGYLDFEIPEVQFIFDSEGKAVDFTKRERNDAHRLIEDFMVLANRVVAKDFSDRKIPFVYRVHERPTREKVINITEYLKGLGIKVPSIPSEITPQYYQELLLLTSGQHFSEIVNKVILRSMQKAVYKNQNLGHFGLGIDYYCHFTAPIRRYADLTIHRIIKEVLRKKSLEGMRIDELDSLTFEAGEQASLTEKNADKAEREVDDLWKAYLMKDKVGEEFMGVITSVTNFGIFVELENTVEGLIKLEDLPDEGFLLFEKQLKLKGQNMSFSVGDKIVVKLLASNIFTRKIDFGFVRFEEKMVGLNK